MKYLTVLAAISSLVFGALAAPRELPQFGSIYHRDTAALEERQGYAFSSWSESGTNVQCNNGGGGSFSVKWNGKGGFVCGKGWNPGSSRTINFSGTYQATGPSYLSIYGWTTNPLVEYYIVENHADLAPGEVWNFKGNFSDSHNATYSIYESQRVNEPSIQGTSTFNQYWSVRAEPRTNGSVNTGEHFNKWNSLGLQLGNQNEMILAVEGYTNASHPTPSGSASMTVS